MLYNQQASQSEENSLVHTPPQVAIYIYYNGGGAQQHPFYHNNWPLNGMDGNDARAWFG
jgi:hypothetical protein